MTIAQSPCVNAGNSKESVERVFRQYYFLTYRAAYGVVGNGYDAEDVAQSIFLRLLVRTPPDFDTNPKGYLYRAAVNSSVSLLRLREKRNVWRLDGQWAPPISFSSSGDREERDTEIHNRLHEAVSELKPRAANILVLRYVRDYSDAEIAKLLGTSRGTIAVCLHRTRLRLKKLMRISYVRGAYEHSDREHRTSLG